MKCEKQLATVGGVRVRLWPVGASETGNKAGTKVEDLVLLWLAPPVARSTLTCSTMERRHIIQELGRAIANSCFAQRFRKFDT